MITKINSIGLTTNYISKKQKQISNNAITNSINFEHKDMQLQGVPASYISFKSTQDDSEIRFTENGVNLLIKAQEIAERYNHTELSPYHVILASIEETEEYIKFFDESNLESGQIEISPLHALVNDFVMRDILSDPDEKDLFLEETTSLKNDIILELNKLPQRNINNSEQNLIYNKNLETELKKTGTEINEYTLLGHSFNALTYYGNTLGSDYLKIFQALSLYKPLEKINEEYLEAFDSKAIELWNKLALGSNLFVLAKNPIDKDRILASFMNTIDDKKHGNYNSENTFIYSIADNVEPKSLIEEIQTNIAAHPDEKLIFAMDLDDLMPKLIIPKGENSIECKPELFELLSLPRDNTRFLFLQNENEYYQLMEIPQIKKSFNDFINFHIPPIQSYEVSNILKKNKDLLSDIKKPFNPDAKEKAILLAEKMDGAYPDKAIELMKRISEYYGDELSKITVKDVDEFAYIASDIFNQDSEKTPIVYNTGKTLATYYGKETTKKDIENIVKQIKTGRIGTQGFIITSKDAEAGAGKKYTAEVIAGEAKVPFVEIDPSDFTASMLEDKISPATNMTKLFNDIKLAAKQNLYKTAIVYVNNFEDFVFTDSYYGGYKQAKAQLAREMEKAIKEDINILVIGSTHENYVPFIPMFIKDFSQNIIVDSPAFNKKSRKEVITSIIDKNKLPLSYRTKAQKEEIIDKLVKLTERFSYVNIKDLVTKTGQIMVERNKNKAGIGEFIEAYLQLITGRTSQPEMPMYNKELITSHECGHATNLEVMNNVYRSIGQPWYKSLDVNFITLDPRGDFLGAVFEGRSENASYPFEAMFSDIVCSYGGHSCEKTFFDMDGSAGISQDLASATGVAKRGVELYGLGYLTGKISNAAKLNSAQYNENVYKDIEVILTNAQVVSDLITEAYRGFNQWFTNKYSKLIGTDNCMVDGDEFRKQLTNWIVSQSDKVKEELKIVDEMILDIIKASKNGKLYYQAKKVVK